MICVRAFILYILRELRNINIFWTGFGCVCDFVGRMCTLCEHMMLIGDLSKLNNYDRVIMEVELFGDNFIENVNPFLICRKCHINTSYAPILFYALFY